jgi:hypothetical protein
MGTLEAKERISKRAKKQRDYPQIALRQVKKRFSAKDAKKQKSKRAGGQKCKRARSKSARKQKSKKKKKKNKNKNKKLNVEAPGEQGQFTAQDSNNGC